MLLTQAIRNKLPKLGTTQHIPLEEKKFIAKFFTPRASWEWYVVEGEPIFNDKNEEIDFQFFGFVRGFENEWGYFNLSELESVNKPHFPPIIERSDVFPRKLSEIKF